MNKGHPWERNDMVFIDKWSLFGGYFIYFIKEWILKCGLYLKGGRYSEMTFNTVLTVHADVSDVLKTKQLVFKSIVSRKILCGFMFYLYLQLNSWK